MVSGEVSSDFWLPDATERQSPAGAILDPDTLSPRSKASLGLEPGRTGCKLATKGTKGKDTGTVVRPQIHTEEGTPRQGKKNITPGSDSRSFDGSSIYSQRVSAGYHGIIL